MKRFSTNLAVAISVMAFASAAQAADLIIDEPVVGVVDAGGDWDGMFVGVFGGYAWGESGYLPNPDISGWLVGVDAGVNFTLTDGIIAGIVGDIAWTDITDSGDIMSLNWLGSLRGRIGFDGGAVMPYLTAGVAFGQGHAAPPDITNTHFGWTAGAGVEIAATEELSIDLQYRYTDLTPADYSAPADIGFTTHQVTAGLHWNF